MVVMSLTAVCELHDLCRCERDGTHIEAVRNRHDSGSGFAVHLAGEPLQLRGQALPRSRPLSQHEPGALPHASGALRLRLPVELVEPVAGILGRGGELAAPDSRGADAQELRDDPAGMDRYLAAARKTREVLDIANWDERTAAFFGRLADKYELPHLGRSSCYRLNPPRRHRDEHLHQHRPLLRRLHQREDDRPDVLVGWCLGQQR